MSKLTEAIEDAGVYCKVRVEGIHVTGMRVDEDHPYDSATNTGGRRLIGYKSEIVGEYGIDDISAAAATLGRKGGSAKTSAKTAASRANGKKGGRPRKINKNTA